MKTIIIGGVAAGMSAASKLRRLDKNVIINVYEKGSDLSYSGCGMPYYIGGVIQDESKLIARRKEEFEAKNINVFVNHEVVSVNPNRKTVGILDRNKNKIITDTYDKLVIATGTVAKRTNVPGSDLVKVYVLNQLTDARELKAAISEVTSVAIIGGGYIGLEVAENLATKGIEVHIIEVLDHLLNIYDKDVAKRAEKALTDIGCKIHLSEALKSYELNGLKTKVLTDRNEYDVDMVIEAIGVRPATDFLESSGIRMLKNGAIHVNDYMETSQKDVYAAGDCVAYRHIITNEEVFVPLGTHANKSGRIIAENIVGNNVMFPGIIGSNVIKVANLTFAKTGLGIKEAKRLNFDYELVDIKSRDRSGYYPGSKEIHVRIVYDPNTGVLKGAQIVGEQGVSDRINVMAVAIFKGTTAAEFSQMDLAYAPPYNTVWDPLQIATNQIKV